MVDLGCVWNGFIAGFALGAGAVLVTVAGVMLVSHYLAQHRIG